MTQLAAVLLALASVPYQAFVGPAYSLWGTTPHLQLAVVAFIALRSTGGVALRTAAVAGGVLDLASLEPFGANMLSLVVAAWMLLESRRAGWVDHAMPRTLVLAGVLWLAMLLHDGLVGILVEQASLEGIWIGSSRVALYSVLLCWPLFSGLDLLGVTPRPRQTSWVT